MDRDRENKASKQGENKIAWREKARCGRRNLNLIHRLQDARVLASGCVWIVTIGTGSSHNVRVPRQWQYLLLKMETY